MSQISQETGQRSWIALLLVGIGVAAAIGGVGWWGSFLAVIGLGLLAEVQIRQMACHGKKKGRWLHSFLLVASGLVGLWVMYELRRTTKGTALIILCAVMIISFDTFSYFGGKRVKRLGGGHKIAPIESPNKTVEGAAIGYVCSLIAGMITLGIIPVFSGMHLGWSVVLIVVVPVFAYLGDINESMAKRRLCVGSWTHETVSIKDFSNVLGAHGGVCDRFDSWFAVFSTVGLVWRLSL